MSPYLDLLDTAIRQSVSAIWQISIRLLDCIVASPPLVVSQLILTLRLDLTAYRSVFNSKTLIFNLTCNLKLNYDFDISIDISLFVKNLII